MNNLKFYIYGVPDGFNLLSGTPDDIIYYQLFYDTSKRGREMRINRRSNGETVYSYLIYNLVSCKGREGAFLGMSIAFTGNEFCTNCIALRDLFEGVYNEVVLKADDKDKIVEPINGGSAVGKFCIPKFGERREMCEKIGRIIVSNITNELANFIGVIDSSFDNSKEGRILTLPLGVDNTSIEKVLRSYTWVSLSSECKVVPILQQSPGGIPATSQDLLSVHFINELTNKVSSYKDFIIQGLKGMVSSSDISSKRNEINHYLSTIEKYAGRQPELTKLKKDYMSIYNEVVDLKPGQQLPPPFIDSQSLPPSHFAEFIDLFRQYRLVVISVLCAVVFVIGSIRLFPGRQTEEKFENADTATNEKPELLDNDSTNLAMAKELDESIKKIGKYTDADKAWELLDKYKGEKSGYEVRIAMEYASKVRDAIIKTKTLAESNKIKDHVRNSKKRLREEAYNALIENIKSHEDEIEPKPKAPTPLPHSSNNLIFYTADSNYKYAESDRMLVQDKRIRVKRNQYYFVKNVTNFKVRDGQETYIECDKTKDGIRIRPTTAGVNVNVTFNDDLQCTYIFNITN